MATTVYNKGKWLALTGAIGTSADLRVLLTSASYAPDPDHHFVSDVSNELVGTGYARKALASVTVTENDVGDLASLDAADVTWTGASFGTPAYAVVYLYNASDSAAALVCAIALSPAVATSGGDFSVTWAAGGILKGA